MSKKILIVSLALFMIIAIPTTVKATKISEETVKVDLGRISHVEVKLDYEDLTSEQISYSVPFPAGEIEAISDGEQLKCEKENLEIGTEFLCTPPSKENFTVTLNYETDALTEKNGEIWNFVYNYNVVKPIASYRIRFILPEARVSIKASNLVCLAQPNPAVGKRDQKEEEFS